MAQSPTGVAPAHSIYEVTIEEGFPELSSQHSTTPQRPRPQISNHGTTSPTFDPVDTTSSAGMHSCKDDGCNQCVNPGVKLERHKCTNHRKGHHCDLINPKTGMPCDSSFSRSYELTRHNNTRHSVHKPKFRCPRCPGEKFFLRPDALTRHLQVVHSDQKRKTRRKKSSPTEEGDCLFVTNSGSVRNTRVRG